ncbi:DUF454 family protein [Loigolactobacillus binensis]|uniref:DUF454 family protein n=1 Tax=Loigolactobacillus binensis TaxID=2559922 RepID=A0ABW3E9P2_9LACO|nr:DUF454 family protein [Loigolactobacillus binensis]
MVLLLIRLFWSFSAFTSLLIGLAGLIFPIIPGIPFLILALFSLEKLSPKFNHWLMTTKAMRWLQSKQPKLARWLVRD